METGEHAVSAAGGDRDLRRKRRRIQWPDDRVDGNGLHQSPMTYISVRPSRHSYDIIKRRGGFVINLTTEEMTFATDYLGVRSGADEDKLARMNLDYDIGDIIKAPLLKKSPVCIECRTVEVKELGSHHMFLAEVVKVHVEEDLMDENNKFHLNKSRPVTYSHGSYFGLGKYRGKFGYSVEKKKKRHRKPRRKKE